MIFALGAACALLSLINLFACVYYAAVESYTFSFLCIANFALLGLLVQIGMFG